MIENGGDNNFDDMIQEILLIDGEIQITWRERRPIPEAPRWFETVWNDYLEGK